MAIDKIANDRSSFDAHQWEVGEAITKANMNTLENHVKTVNDYSIEDRNKINVIIDEVNANSRSVNELNSTVGTSDTSGLRGRVQTLEQTAQSSNSEGHQALVQIQGATTQNDPVYDSLDARFNAVELTTETNRSTLDAKIDSTKSELQGNIQEISRVANNAATELSTARVTYGNVYDTLNDISIAPTTLGQVIKDIDRRIINATATAEDVQTLINTNTIVNRLNALDNNETISTSSTPYNVPQIISELRTAHQSTANAVAGESYHTYTDIDARFEADETQINVNTAAIGTLNDNKVSKSDVRNDFTHTDTNLPLSAGAGKQLRDLIGGTYSSSNTVTAYIDSSAATAESNANSYTDSISSEIDTRLDAIDGGNGLLDRDLPDIIDELDDAHTSSVIKEENAQHQMVDKTYASLDERFEAIETHKKNIQDEITAAHTSSVVKTKITKEDNGETITVDEDTTFGSLDARFERVEGNVDTIAKELKMYNTQTNAIQDANSRIDTIEENVVAIGKEIGMLQDLGTVIDLSTAVSRNDTDIDKIKSELNNARIQIGTDENEAPIMGTLDDRFDANESDITAINAKIGGNYDSVNTVAAAIATAESDAVTSANGYTDTATAEIGGAHRQNVTNDTLDNRFDDAESRLTTLETTVDTPTTGLSAKMTAVQSAISHTVGEGGANDFGGLTERLTAAENDIDTLESAVNNQTTGLGAAYELASNASDAINDPDGILDRLQSLETEPKSATVIIDNTHITYDSQTNKPTNIGETPVENKDYLLQGASPDTKYYYWKYIGTSPNGVWEQISGAGGGGMGDGNNNAEVYESTQALNTDITNHGHDENKDYYVMESDNVYHHYRYLKSLDEDEQEIWTQIEIGQVIDPNVLKTYNIAIQSVQENNETNSYLYLFDFDADENNHPTDAVINQRIANEDYVNKVKLPAGGGGGTVNLMQIRQITPVETIAALNSGEPTLLRFFFTTGEVGGKGYYNLTIDGKKIFENDQLINGGNPANAAWEWPTKEVDGQTVDMTIEEGAALGFYTLDVSEYCTSLKDYTIRLDIRLMTNRDITANAEWTLRVMNFYLTSSSPDGLIISTKDTATIKYTPYGAIQKTLHVVIDDQTNNERTVSIGPTINGRERDYEITQNLGHGVHKIDMWMTANASGIPLTSNTITKEYIWYDPNDISTPIILASPLRGKTITATAYSEIDVPFSVYNKSANSYVVEYYLNYGTENQQLVNTDQLSGNISTNFTYVPTEATANPEIPDVFTIKVGNVTLNINMVINAITQDIAPVSGAIIDFDPTLYNNNSINREPSWAQGAYQLSVSDNFNWSTSSNDSGGGYREDADGKCFIIKAGSYVDINYPFFKPNSGTVFSNGAEMKIIFKTEAVRQADAVWFTSLGTLQNKTVGIQLNAHNGWLKTNKAVDYDATDTEEEYEVWVSGKTDYALNDIVLYRKKATDSYIIYKYTKLCKNYTIVVPNDSSMSSFWSSLEYTDWISGTAYKKGNIVAVGNVIYSCVTDLIEDVQAISPVDDSEHTYWKIIISPWASNNPYDVDAIVTTSGASYVCIKNVRDDALTLAPANDTNHEYWVEIGDWVSGTTYEVGDVVIYNDSMYRCIKDVVNQFVQTPKDLANKNWLAMGMTQDKIVATNSYLYFPYSENDKIELDININQYDSSKKNNFIMSYEDGVPSKAYAYDAKTGGDSLQHTSSIRIGSPDCDVYIYKLRIYNKSLTDKEILKNFIADGKTVKDKIDRYDRNCIYCDEYNQFSLTDDGNATLNPVKLAEKMPNVKVLMLDTPRFTTGKKDFVKGATLRCLQIQKDENGNFIYPDEGNWFFQKGFHAGQGTTSDNYGQAGRNVDFLFECDGKHWPTKEKDIKDKLDLKGADKDYISSVLRGNSASKWNTRTKTWEPTSVYDDDNHEWKPSENLTQEELANWTAQAPEYCEDWKGDTCKVALTPTSVPNNYFNLKVNIASSENVNNALFQKRYNDYVPYQSPAKEKQIAIHGEAYAALGVDPESIVVKNSMEFVPAVLFVRENDPDTANHTEFTDCEWHFYALGNIGDSKKTDYTRAYDPDDMAEYTVENSDNNTNNGQFQSGVYFKNNNHDIRYIETEYDPWSNKTAYKTGAKVIYDGQLYIRTGADMELPALQEGETLNLAWNAADWQVQSITITYNSLNVDWQANKVYSKGDLVYRNNVLYSYKNDEPSSDASWAAEKWTAAETTYLVDDLAYHNNQLYRYIGSESEPKNSWISADWSAVTTKLAGMDYLNPMDYIYPITTEEWNIKYANKYLNNRHYTLLAEEFDGDHSFEFRYACKGDYRDGSLINDTNGDSTIPDPDKPSKFLTKDTVQYDLNKKVFYAFYEWIVTTPRNKYRTEAEQWFVPEAMEFFYAYTHYYTMMDNRAKNTFWHFAKTGIHHLVTNPIKDMLHVYDELVNGEYVRTQDTEINSEHTYYTEYAFDLWVYDCDTAAGIDNNGALIFPYGKEDGDYRVEDDPNSGYAFNGAGSIFWRRLKEPAEKGGFEDGIIDVMVTSKTNCFNSQHLINQFDNFQACYPEEIWRLDIQRKYIRTFTGVTPTLTYDNAVSAGKQNTRFLTSMMQGRKKYQRRQWIRDQGVYFNSKYQLPSITTNTNEYNVTLGAEPESLDVPVDYTLKLTPYQDMYLNVVLGNGTPVPPVRAKAGVEYSIPIPTSGSAQETRVYIQGGDYLSAISNLAPMYPYELMFSHIAHLKKFDMGTDIIGYTNTKLAEQGIKALGDGGGPLLEEVNIKNCHSLASLPSLVNSNNLRIIEAEGTAISGISLPDYTNIEILHLPNSIQELSLHNAINLKDFYMKNNLQIEDYSNLYTLSLINSDRSNKYIWSPETQYAIGDIYMIGTNLYKCKTAHTSINETTAQNAEQMEIYLETNWTLIKADILVPVDWMSVVSSIIEKQSTDIIIDLQELSSATIGDIQELEPLSSTKALIESSYEKIKLTGTVHVTGTWSQVEKDFYAGQPSSVWPQLTLDTTNGILQVKHRVDYVEENARDSQNQLIKSKILKTLYVNDGDTAPDIYATGVLTEKPTKAPTAASIYEFGSINELTNRYIAYSGWSLENSGVPLTRAPIITEDTVIVTYFNEYDHMYYIRWYLHEGDSTPVYETQSRVPYGGGYDVDAPTVQYIQSQGKSTCSVNVTGGQITYSIFKGWDKLPTNITPNANDKAYNIYGVWEEATTTIPQMFASNNISNLSPQQLLALSAMNNNTKQTYADYITNQIAVNTRITYPLGYEGPSGSTATEIIPLNNILRLDAGDEPIATNFQPLLVNNDDFTFAIDYCLDPNAEYENTTSYGILASCYYNSNGVKSGFAIYYDKEYDEVRVGFGDIFNVNNTYSKCIGTSSTMGQRNILVIRHTKGSSDLHIYSGLNSGMTIPENIYSDVITYPNNFNCNSKIYIGTLVNTDPSDGITSMIDSCKSTVYWAKFWAEDLGSGECKRIASWPRETITYAIASLSNNASSRATNPPAPSIQLVSLNTSAHGRVVQPKINSADYSWNNSPIQKICNQRIFNSLPILFQSILYKTQVYSRPINYIIDNNLGNSQKLGTITATYDYVYAYSAANVPSNTSDYNAEGSLFAWNNNTENMACYLYNNGNWNADSASAYYMSIRFPNKAIMWGTSSANKLRVFVAQSGNVPNSNIAYSIDQKMGGIKSGDIYVEGENAYMYVYTSEIARLGLQVKSAAEDNRFATSSSIEADRRGSWIAAEDYWTRSLIPNASGNGTNFAFVKKIGALDASTLGNTQSRKKLSYIISL